MQKVGILGGGQLGRMLLQAAANYPVETYVLEKDPDCPAAHLCQHFTQGDIRDFESVYQFGKELHSITIEIENVNIEALEKLEREGINVFPKPSVLRIIKNKIYQKEFYKNHQTPTAPFVVIQNLEEIQDHLSLLPAVQKLAEGGYDGRGVVVIENSAEVVNGFDAPSVLEKKIIIKKEVSQIIAVNKEGKTALYPLVEMVVNEALNQLDYQLCPAQLPEEVTWKAEAIALDLVRHFASPGIFAVELIIDDKDKVWVNETAPRVHNSGHHTIEGHYSSQFDMLWRIILGYPLGNPKAILPSVMVNITGSKNNNGPALYNGLEEVLSLDNAFVHIYGKKETKPGRKMGHVTILGAKKEDLIFKAHKVKQVLSVIG